MSSLVPTEESKTRRCEDDDDDIVKSVSQLPRVLPVAPVTRDVGCERVFDG
jgi:hypothetical protein